MTAVTAPPEVQARLLELQDLDSRTLRAKAQLGRLRADADLKERQQAVMEARAHVAEVEKAGHDVDAAAGAASSTATATRARRDRTRRRLDAGEGGPKELTAMQHELETLEGLLGRQEEEALTAMQAADEAEAGLAAARERLAAAEQAVEDRAAELRSEGQRITEEGRALTVRRATLVGLLPEDLVALYDSARRQNGGIGAARLEGGRSGASGTDLSPADVARLSALPPEAVAQDPETGALLIRG